MPSHSPTPPELLGAQFVQDWKHIRHLENQLWRLFTIYLTIVTASLTLMGIVISQSSRSSIAALCNIMPLALGLAALINVWAFFIVRIIVKWRREFVLHFLDLNLIRKEGYGISDKDSRTVLRFERTPILKPTSIFVKSCLVIVATAFLSSSALMGLASSIEASGLPIGVSFAFSGYGALLMAEIMMSDGYSWVLDSRERARKGDTSRGMLASQFSLNLGEDKRARRWILRSLAVLELSWVVMSLAYSYPDRLTFAAIFILLLIKIAFFGYTLKQFRQIEKKLSITLALFN